MTSQQPTPEAVEAVARFLNDDCSAGNNYHSSLLWDELIKSGDVDGPHLARDDAGRLLAFIRDAIHRPGDDADAIRQALGLRLVDRDYNDGGPIDSVTGLECRVVSEWRGWRP